MPTDPRDSLQQALGDRYILQRELGRGGMATVYLAHDTKHDRPVAVKLLHADLAAALGPERFRREITLAARLQHPHILAVHDSGEGAPGQLWYTMPYVAGESLRARLQRERQLPLHDALRIAGEVAHALDYAHRQGVIHRDIKPENILLTQDGQALVADFGIARPLTPSTPNSTLTEVGMALGTAQYMSPEQAAGERTIDGRSDVFSLSAVLYEMLIGEPPFTGPNAQAVVAKILSAPTPSARASRPAVPIAVDHTITKALDRTPADRFATAAEFAQALQAADRSPPPAPAPPPHHRQRIPVAALALGLGILIGGGMLFAWRSRGTGSAAPEGVRLAVLPFDNIGDTANAYFADGLTDAVRTKLTALPGVEVIASNSSAQYRNTTKTSKQIGQELGVRYLLVGKVRSAKGRIQVAPELIDATNATDKWSASYDTTLTDVFQVQGAIATQTAAQLGVALGSHDRAQLDSAPTHNIDAYNAYLQGMELLSHTFSLDLNSKRAAIADFRSAATLDPSFALAWARLGLVESRLAFNQPGSDIAKQARADIDHALALNATLPAAHHALGAYYGNVLNDDRHDVAEETLALRGAPNDIEIMGSMSASLVNLSRPVAAAKILEHAQTIDPRSVGILVRLADAYVNIGDWDHAVTEANRALTLEPNHTGALTVLALALTWRGDEDSSLAVWHHLLALDPSSAEGTAGIAWVAIRRGDLATAHATLATAPAGTKAQTIAEFGMQYPWALNDADADQFLNRRPPFGGFTNSTDWPTARAGLLRLRGDSARVRATADTIRQMTEAALRDNPGAFEYLLNHALAEAFLGHTTQALAELTEAGTHIEPGTLTDVANLQYALATIRLMAGDRQGAADALAASMHLPGHRSTLGELRLDPTWIPLRSLPTFQHLIAEDKPIV